MKTYRLIAFVILSLAVVSPCLEARREEAPGILKKIPLIMSNVVLDISSTSVTLSWSTNKLSNSSISVSEILDPVPNPAPGVAVYLDPTLTTEHRMTSEPIGPAGFIGTT